MTSLKISFKSSMFRDGGTYGITGTCITIALLLPILSGCGDSQGEKAREEVGELKSRVAKLDVSLRAAKGELADVREELAAAVEMRDALDLQVGKLTRERDEALELAKTAEQTLLNLTERLKSADAGKSQTYGQVAQLEGTIAQLQATIADQQTVIGDLERALQEQVADAGTEIEEITEELEVGEGDGQEPDGIAP